MFASLRRSGAPAGAGLAFLFLLLGFVLSAPATIAGVDLDVIRDIAARSFTGHISWFTFRVAVFALIFGAVAGLWARWVGGPGVVKFLVLYLLFVAALNARAMAQYPQLYASAFYLRGGFLAAVQTAVTGLPHPLLGLLPIFLGTLAGLRRAPPRLPARFALALFALPLVILPAARGPAVKQPNILILAADSLRPDYITAQRAPNITKLRDTGTSWPATYVHTPRTFPSWGEILSANYGPRTGIRHMFPAAEERRFSGLSLVNEFHRAGYRSFVLSDYAGDIFPRFASGFSDTTAPMFSFSTILEEQILRTQPWLFGLLAWRGARELFPVLREFSDLADPAWLTADLAAKLPGAQDTTPFFGVVFFSVTHFPYAAPFPDYKAEADPRYRGPYLYGKPPLVGESDPAADDINQVRALFGGAVRSFDRQVGAIRMLLAARGLDTNTMIVILADHGENLYERTGDTGHGDHLFGDETLRIPFVVYDPTRRLEPGIRTAAAQSVDILPTLMDLAGMTPPAGRDGHSMAATTAASRDVVFAESGIWFAETNRKLLKSRRIDYPDILHLGTVDTDHEAQIILGGAARPMVLAAKHHAAFDPNYKVIYQPTTAQPVWEAVDIRRDRLEAKPFAIPAPGAWAGRDVTAAVEIEALQARLVRHVLSEGSKINGAGWILPGDGTWAP